MNPLVYNCYLIIIMALLCSCKIEKNKHTNIGLFILFSFVSLLIFRSFLDIDSVPDLPNYKIGYEQISSMDLFKVPFGEIYDVKMPEPGFRILMKLITFFTSSFNVFLFLFGILWLLGYYKIILKYSVSISLSIVVLVLTSYHQSIFVLRQHFAMMLVVLSYPYIISKNFRKFLLIFILAVCFHQTALILFPLYFLYNIKNKRTLIICLLAIALFCFLSFSVVFRYLGTEVLVGLATYVDSEEVTNSTDTYIVLINLFVYIIMARNNVWNNGINKLMLISLILGLIISVNSIGIGSLNRLALYYTNISFLLIPKTMYYINNRFVRYVYVLSFLSLSYYMTFYGSGFQSLTSYKF